MTMSRKHYRQVAKILQEATTSHFSGEESPHYAQGWTVSEIACGLAELFSQVNPLFDRDKFLAACFPKMDEVKEDR